MKNERVMKRRAMMMAAAFACGVCGAAEPKILWVSAPVKPGEHVMLQGGDWTRDAHVEVEAKGRTFRVKPVRVTDDGLVFAYPKELDLMDVARGQVVNPSGERSAAFRLNAADPWWVQPGELGVHAPGAEVRIFGNALDFGGRARVRLVGGAELAVTRRDTYQLAARLPKDLTSGTYGLEVANGLDDGWTKAGEIAVGVARWPWEGKRVFNPVDFGAVGNDGFDDTAAIQAALDAAGAAGGGIVELPRGRFIANDELRIPPKTLLRGVSRALTMIYWIDTEDPPEALVSGTTEFGVSDIFLSAGKYRSGLVARNSFLGKGPFANKPGSADCPSRNILVRNVSLRLLIDQWVRSDMDAWADRLKTKGNGVELRYVENLVFENNDITTTKLDTWTYNLSGRNVRIRNNKFDGAGRSWAPCTGEMLLYEGNVAYGMTYGLAPAARHVYFGGNTGLRMQGGDREGMTQDGGRTAFRDAMGKGYVRPAVCEGRRIAFDLGPLKGCWFGKDFWKGYQVQIVEGRGAGQSRDIVEMTDDSHAVIDAPWTIAPDETSRFTIVGERRWELFVDNRFEETTCALQLYGGSSDAILARNTSVRAGGFLAHGMQYAAALTMWRVQMLDNVIAEGNGLRGPANQIPSTDSILQIANNPGMKLVRWGVVRNNVIRNNGYLEVDCVNGLVEGNRVADADLGVSGGRACDLDTVVFAGNAFENVEAAYAPVFAKKGTFPEGRPAVAPHASADPTAPRAVADWSVCRADGTTVAVTGREIPFETLFPAGVTSAVATARLVVMGDVAANLRFWPQKARCFLDGRRVGTPLSKRTNLWIGTLTNGVHELRIEIRPEDFKGYWKRTASVDGVLRPGRK